MTTQNVLQWRKGQLFQLNALCGRGTSAGGTRKFETCSKRLIQLLHS